MSIKLNRSTIFRSRKNYFCVLNHCYYYGFIYDNYVIVNYELFLEKLEL